MEAEVLKASHREITGKKVKNLRKEGKLPAIIYGQGVTPIPITLDLKEATKLLKNTSSSSLLTIEVDGEKHNTLVRERQRDFIRGMYKHIDFLVVSLTEKVKAKVNLLLEGEPPAIDLHGGMMLTGLGQVEVESFPQDLPERIVVDLSGLMNVGDGIYVKDLPVPDNVEVLDDPEEMIVMIASQVLSEKGDEEEFDEGAEPEVIEKGKKDEDDEDE
ncbi:MAG: 50S ribosomal protein L25 [Anaerolineae bacterium]|nr:50S ribosomal protein L25 [Anaerolineae bacterium]